MQTYKLEDADYEGLLRTITQIGKIDADAESIWADHLKPNQLKSLSRRYVSSSFKLRGEFNLKHKKKIENSFGIFPDARIIYNVYAILNYSEDGTLDTEKDSIILTSQIITNQLISIESEKFVCFCLNFSNFLELLEYERKRDIITEPDVIIFHTNDPRMCGDYYSEVSETVAFIGSKYQAEKEWEWMRRCRNSSSYYTYPRPIGQPFNLKMGEKIIIHETIEQTNDYATDIYFEEKGSE